MPIHRADVYPGGRELQEEADRSNRRATARRRRGHPPTRHSRPKAGRSGGAAIGRGRGERAESLVRRPQRPIPRGHWRATPPEPAPGPSRGQSPVRGRMGTTPLAKRRGPGSKGPPPTWVRGLS